MRLILVVALAAAAVVPAQAARAASAKVSYVAGAAFYVDAGSADGLQSGAVLDVVRRRGRAKAQCTVAEVSEHHAVCGTKKGIRLSPGDRVTFHAQAPAARTRGRPHEPVPPSSSFGPALAQLRAAKAPLVAFKKSQQVLRAAWGGRASVTLRQQAWLTSGTDGTFARPSLDAGARASIGVLPGLYASTALRVQGDLLAPPTERFRPGDLQLYVWDASVGLGTGPVVGAVGRFRPRRAPGMELLDGIQAGYQAFGGALEVGGYAGSIPDLVTIVPSLDRLTAGAYFSVDVAPAKDLLLLPRARVGLIGSPDAKTVRAEAEAETQLLWGSFLAAGASVRAGAGGTPDALPSLDAARVDLDLVPLASLRLHGGWRYLAPLAVDWDAGPGIPGVGGAHHGDVSARYLATPWLAVGAESGVGVDVLAKSTRGYAGPVVGLPQAFGPLGGLEVGYDEEALLGAGAKGAWAGRTAYVSTILEPVNILSVVTRASYFEDAAPNDSLREAALMTLVEAPLLPWLSVHGSAQVMASLPPVDGSARATPTTLVADLGVSGSL